MTQRSFWLSKLHSKLGTVAVITALGRLGQDDHKFKASLGYNEQQLKQKWAVIPSPAVPPNSIPFPCILALTLHLNAYWCLPVSILHSKFPLVFVGPDQVWACANLYVYYLLWTVGVLGPNLTDSVSLVVWHQGWWMGPWGLPWDFWQCVFTLELLYQISTNLQFSQHHALESILHAHSK